MFRDRTYTRDEFEALIAKHPQRRFELIHGAIVEKMPTELHAYIVMFIGRFLLAYLDQQPIGYVLPEARYGLPSDDENDRVPDLAFRTHDKGPLVSKGTAPFMPDLAIEIQSPSQGDRELADKAAYYLANGSRMVWLIYPDRRLVEILTADDRQLLTENGTISGGDVLPGFSVPVKDIFPAEPPSQQQE